MKKVLALVLALVMVLALVPVAFAATYTVSNSDYKVSAKIEKSSAMTQIVDPDFNWEPNATGAAPALEIKLPYKQIKTIDESGLWASSADLDITLKLQNLGGKGEVFSTSKNLDTAKIDKVKINGEDKSSAVTLDTTGDLNSLSFKMGDVKDFDKTYEYVVEVSGKGTAADWYEKVTFTVKFTNIDKPVYDLKVAGVSGFYLKDGVWFKDFESTITAPTELIFDLRKNDGSKFTETAYAAAKKGAYLTPTAKVNPLSDSKTTVVFNPEIGTEDGNKAEIYIQVETQYAIYQGKITTKVRANVKAVDPKGVNFDKDEYTIKVNEVFFPGYSFIVDPLKDIVADINLEQTAYGEKNIIDIDKNRKDEKDAIIGLKEGTAYVKLSYTMAADADGVNEGVTYTDTAKVIVSGSTTVQPDENFVVTVASGSCLYKRAAASTSSANLGKLQNGTVIKVAEIKDGWAKVIDDGNYTNYYVNAAYITRQATKVANGTGVVIARCLNVRAGSGTTYAVVGHLYRNAKIDITEIVADGAWGKITYQGNTAYVAMKYIQ